MQKLEIRATSLYESAPQWCVIKHFLWIETASQALFVRDQAAMFINIALERNYEMTRSNGKTRQVTGLRLRTSFFGEFEGIAHVIKLAQLCSCGRPSQTQQVQIDTVRLRRDEL